VLFTDLAAEARILPFSARDKPVALAALPAWRRDLFVHALDRPPGGLEALTGVLGPLRRRSRGRAAVSHQLPA